MRQGSRHTYSWGAITDKLSEGDLWTIKKSWKEKKNTPSFIIYCCYFFCRCCRYKIKIFPLSDPASKEEDKLGYKFLLRVTWPLACAYQLVSLGTAHKPRTSETVSPTSPICCPRRSLSSDSDMRANHSLGHQLRRRNNFSTGDGPVRWEIWDVVVRSDWDKFCIQRSLSLSLSLSGSSSSEENHRDLPRRQQFNEAWSYLNKSARSSSRDVHSFFFFYLKRAGGATWIFHSFSPSASATARNPACRL